MEDYGSGDRKKKRSKHGRLNCAICFEVVEVSERFAVSHCAHAFCNSCVGKHVAGKIAENVAVVGCPDPECEDGLVEMNLCRDIVPPELLDPWNLALRKDCSALLTNDGSVNTRETDLPTPPPTDAMASYDEFYCTICMEAVHVRELFPISGCTHLFCVSCVSQYIAAKVEDNVLSISCPDPGCKDGALDPEACRDVIPPQLFQLWGSALCDSALGSSKFYCPFNDCSALLLDERGDGEAAITDAECPHCRRIFCAQCRVAWHDGITCEEFQRLGVDERGKDDLLLRKIARESKWQRCPKCKMYVERTYGCAYIVCRCQHRFCYLCAPPMSRTHVCRCERTRRMI